jgi:aspartate aminotransferase-like enzyme
MYQVDEGLRLMEAEGDGVFARHVACAAMARAGLRACGFELLAGDDVASKTVTAAWIPEGLDWKTFNAGLKRRGLVLAGGQGKLKGRIFRLGHLGSVTTDDVLAAVSVLEATAIECGLPVQPGTAVAAAQQARVAAQGA